jgi:hypothetical protein
VDREPTVWIDAAQRDALRRWAELLREDERAVIDDTFSGGVAEMRFVLARHRACDELLEELAGHGRAGRYELRVTPRIALLLAYIEREALRALREPHRADPDGVDRDLDASTVCRLALAAGRD